MANHAILIRNSACSIPKTTLCIPGYIVMGHMCNSMSVLATIFSLEPICLCNVKILSSSCIKRNIITHNSYVLGRYNYSMK